MDKFNPNDFGTPKSVPKSKEYGWCESKFENEDRSYLTFSIKDPEYPRSIEIGLSSKSALIRFMRTKAACKSALAQELIEEARELLMLADAIEYDDEPQDEWIINELAQDDK